jgi:hypothetical protein
MQQRTHHKHQHQRGNLAIVDFAVFVLVNLGKRHCSNRKLSLTTGSQHTDTHCSTLSRNVSNSFSETCHAKKSKSANRPC